jgi:phosphoglycerate dehydrogenase-like enzyme
VTRGWLDARRLGLIRRGGYFVNVGRGPIVDETALTGLLQRGHLSGAGLDVFAVEPLPNSSPLWNMDNVIITPHVGAQSTTRYRDVTLLFTENVRRMGAGEPLINLVDRELGFPRPETRLRAGWRTASWAQQGPR